MVEKKLKFSLTAEEFVRMMAANRGSTVKLLEDFFEFCISDFSAPWDWQEMSEEFFDKYLKERAKQLRKKPKKKHAKI